MNKYLDIVDESKCTGCGACLNVCPMNAITMKEGKDTFLYPFVDPTRCIHCGKCTSACPIIKTSFNKKAENCYAATVADTEILTKSSSGGIFSLLAEYVIDHDGVVCGVEFDKNWNAKHIIIDNKSDLHKLRGSKYIQSNVGSIYKEVQNILSKGKKVLFSGTPCQIAALYGVLKEKPDNLITVDIVCHGVPSQEIWQAYLKQNFKTEDIQYISHRDKERTWTGPFDVVTVINNVKKFHPEYMMGFINNVFLRESCGSCKFAQTSRVSDITLADFWGIWEKNPQMYNNMGVSLILTNTEKGAKTFNAIREKCLKISEEKIDAAKMNYPLFRSTVAHPNRSYFFQKFNETKDFNNSLYNTLNYVSIINFWWCNNYGAMCTAYALQETIKDMGYIAKTVNYIPKWFYDVHYKGGISEKFAKDHFNLTELVHSKKELENLNNECSAFVCGSDQIWRYGVEQLRNWEYYKDFENLCFLSYAHNDKKKIAYAASFACDTYEGPYRNRQFVRYLLNRFQHISVREQDGVDICRNEFGVNATCVLDPVFLKDKKFWSDLADTSNLTSKNHICYYVLDTPDAKAYTLDYIRKKVTGDLVDISKGFNEPLENWLYYIKNCKLFVADSFHGCCLAIIFNKPFICFKNTQRGGSRFDSILGLLGLQNRILMDYERIEDRADLFEEIDYNQVNIKLQKEKEKSLKWLKKSLSEEFKPQNTPLEDMIEATFNLLEESMQEQSLQKKGCILRQEFESNQNDMLFLYIASHLTAFRIKKICYKLKSIFYKGEKAERYKKKYSKYKNLIKNAKSAKKHIKFNAY